SKAKLLGGNAARFLNLRVESAEAGDKEAETVISSSPVEPEPGRLTYSSYLKVPELLDLQKPQSSPIHHDELLFIVVHQTYELWFKELLHDVFFGALQAIGKLPPAREGATEREQFEGRARAVHALYKDEHHYRDWIDVCERLTEFDELVVSWRLRHIQLVERIIGIRMGTGGSTGASYLKLTLDKKFFPELWEARTLLTE